MAATVILMAILGCGEAGGACEPVGMSPVRYESVSACVAAQDEVLAATDVMFPVVTAECRPAGRSTPASLSTDKSDRAPRAKSPLLKQAALRS